jgi:hypothetical protein
LQPANFARVLSRRAANELQALKVAVAKRERSPAETTDALILRNLATLKASLNQPTDEQSLEEKYLLPQPLV